MNYKRAVGITTPVLAALLLAVLGGCSVNTLGDSTSSADSNLISRGPKSTLSFVTKGPKGEDAVATIKLTTGEECVGDFTLKSIKTPYWGGFTQGHHDYDGKFRKPFSAACKEPYGNADDNRMTMRTDYWRGIFLIEFRSISLYDSQDTWIAGPWGFNPQSSTSNVSGNTK